MDLEAEYSALHSAAVFAPVRRTAVLVTGSDRGSFLHNLCTNDVRGLEPGAGCEAFFTNVQGKVLCHGLLFCEASSLLIDTVEGQSATLLPHLDKYLIREDVSLADRSNSEGVFLAAGPQLPELLAERGVTELSMLSHQRMEWDHVPVFLRRVPLALLPCYLISCDAADGARLAESFQGALQAVSHALLEVARLEAGFPHFGRDITVENLPQEVNRNQQAISFTKGCYLGQETVARIDALGHVNRYLVSLTFASAEAPSAGTELMSDGKVVGKVTSAAYSPKQETAIGLGYVRREVAERAAELHCPQGAVKLRLPAD